ncbi:MAG: DNA recombination protein RmuC [Phycisphaeraceae bacterium]|nr:DNA recombination protein RmuC [Phycisphaeraceae bacterium]
MTSLEWVLIVAVAGLAAVAAWLATGRLRAAVALGASEQARADLDQRRLAAEAEQSRLRAALQQCESALADAGKALAAQTARLEAEVRAREADGAEAARALQDALDAERRVHREQSERERQVNEERLAAVARSRQEIEQRLAQFETKMRETFSALAGETLRSTTGEFLKLADQKLAAKATEATADLEQRRLAVEQMVKPIAEVLQKTEARLGELEQARVGAYSGLLEQVRQMQQDNARLRDETGRLVRALREPQVRGRYGEVQLRKVAELAGMTNYCDFDEQDSTRTAEGDLVRPDMVVRLPSQRVIVVDAKMNFQAYLDAHQAATPDEAEQHLDRFARHVAEQAVALSRKKYWTQYDGSPEFVVMFVPHDAFLDAALSRRPELLEDAARSNVILATPSTLIALLRAVAVGYQEQRLAKAAEELRTIGRELMERCARAFGLAAEIGDGLTSTVKKYNEFVGSYQGRVEPSLRRMEELGVKAAKELPDVQPVTINVRDADRPRLPGA